MDTMEVEIQLTNAAFEEGNAGAEIARILRDLADKIDGWPCETEWSIRLADSNGNTAGRASLT